MESSLLLRPADRRRPWLVCLAWAVGLWYAGDVTAQQTWVVDRNHSAVEFRVAHMLVRQVRGRFERFDVTLRTDDAELSGARIAASVDAASISTGNSARDESLRSDDFLDVVRFPNLTFTSRQVREDSLGRFALSGDLTIRGVSRETTFLVVPEAAQGASRATDRLRFIATTTLDRREFGINFSETDLLASLARAVAIVGDEVEVRLVIELVRSP